AAREALVSATALERQAGAFANPTISYQHEAASGGGVDNSQGIASIDQPLDVAGRSARRRAAAHRRAAADARLQDAEATLDLTVVRAYAQVLAADRRAQLASDAGTVFARAKGVSEARLQSGDISGFAHRRLR
ncbi:MAG: TolC family protein, partial [Gemmatimonadaceae bacterium]